MEPYSLVRETGEGSWLDADLACGLQNQRLMARPPARAGGRSGLLTGGKSGKPNGYSLLSPKGHLPTPPARPAGGRAVTGPSNVRAAGQVTSEKYNFHTTPPESESRGKNLFPLGFFPPFLPKKWGPGRAGQGSPPFQRRGAKPTRPPHPPHSRLSNPKLRMRFKLSRQFSFTFTQVSR